MRRKKELRRATRSWVALLLLAAGCLLPGLIPGRAVSVPTGVEALLTQVLTEETDPARITFVRTACGLVGKVGYFWGGKSHVMGWNPQWGWFRRVTAKGSESSGKLRCYGLDCSGFVSWAAITAWRDTSVYDTVGEGVKTQYANCAPITDPRPGDLAFFGDLSHVGIVLGRDGSGCLWVVHCSASRKGVVVTPASVGFSLYGTPAIFDGEEGSS